INNAFQATSAEASAKAGTGYKPEVIVATRGLDSYAGSPERDKKTEEGSVGAIEITVTDNGPGIPDEIKDKIFQPFFTTKSTGQGTGLGLSLSYDILKAHGGEIRVETNSGAGSAFVIQLPVVRITD
ncbi:MAG: HAMP domain-containing histidine kinase, partial [Saprospiraceae bacterium]|nr:HAMP domain-containing histidine kinase [Saprospiraceae bacterium]